MKRLEDFEEYDDGGCIFEEDAGYGPCAGFTSEVDWIATGFDGIYILVKACEAHELVWTYEIESTELLDRDENYQFARVDFS